MRGSRRSLAALPLTLRARARLGRPLLLALAACALGATAVRAVSIAAPVLHFHDVFLAYD
jgi:hypothetical protein